MTSQTTVRVGIVGAGDICRDRHFPGLASIDSVNVVAVCNRSKASGQAVADKWNIPDVMDDWQALVGREDLDAIFIGTWPYMHETMSVASLEAGKHVFCQARMAMNLAQAKNMVAAAHAHPKQVNMICPPPTRMPYEAFIHEVIRDGGLGELTCLRLTSVNGGNLNTNAVHWREQREFSGNQVMGMGIYAETLNAWVGPYETLSASTSTPIATKTDQEGNTVDIQVPQCVSITGQLQNGAMALEQHFGLCTDKTTAGDELVIWGTQGTLRYDFYAPSIEMAKPGEPLKKVDVPARYHRDWLVEQDFIDAVRAAKAGRSWSVSPDFDEGLLYMQKVEAVHTSATSGSVVNLAQQ
jgi:predicted dehydrogenase